MLDTLQIAWPNSWLAVLLTALLAYLLGSINSAVLVSRICYHEDVRDKGSGNAGATNVLRNYGKKAALITMLGDLAKSIVAVYLGGFLLTHLQLTGDPHISYVSLGIVGRYLAGTACVLGHLYPVFFGFRGGKGVMTSCGMILILDFRVALVCIVIFAVTTAISRMVSLGSVLAVGSAPFLVYVFGRFADHHSPETLCFCTVVIAVIALIVIFKHWQNLVRIAHGKENKISFRK